jgi:hypothetical protein
MNADVLSTNAADGIAVITLSSPKRIYFDRVHETVSGKALDRAMEIARRLSSFPSESVACIKRRSATPPRRRWHRDWHSNEISS